MSHHAHTHAHDHVPCRADHTPACGRMSSLGPLWPKPHHRPTSPHLRHTPRAHTIICAQHTRRCCRAARRHRDKRPPSASSHAHGQTLLMPSGRCFSPRQCPHAIDRLRICTAWYARAMAQTLEAARTEPVSRTRSATDSRREPLCWCRLAGVHGDLGAIVHGR